MMMGGNEETKQTFDSISSIVDAEVQRVATISTSGPAQRKRTANALNSGTVPTELLSADGARALELPKGGEPGCGLRLLARRPRLVLVTVYVTFGLLLALLFTVGELEISVDSDAFVNKEDVDVQRVRLAHELFLNSAWNQGPSYGWRAESATENLFNWNYRGRRLREQEGDREQTDEEGGDDEQVHLDASAPTQHGRLLQSSCRSNEGKPTTSFTLIYSARTGSNVLEPQLLQRIAYIELSLARLAERKGLCKYPLSLGSPPPGSSRPALFESCDSCTPIDSALGYIFPSGVQTTRRTGCAPAPTVGGVDPCSEVYLRFGNNRGGAIEDVSAGLRCGPAIDGSELASTLDWLVHQNKTGWFDTSSSFLRRSPPPPSRAPPPPPSNCSPIVAPSTNATSTNATSTNATSTNASSTTCIPWTTPPATQTSPQAQIPSVRGRHRAKYLRSQIPMTLAEWRDAMNDGRALEFMNLLEELRKNPDVNVYTDIVDRYWTLPERQLRADLVGDGILLGVANLLILIFMVFYFRNVLFAFAAVMQLVLALPLTFLIVDVVFKQRPISAFACASIWVVTGVTADNIFVVHETWKAARLLRVNGELASRERRLRWTLAQSARPLFVADGTTAFSLLINCLSPIGGVFQFGLVGGVLIFANFLLVLVYTSALLMMEEQGAFNWCNCWRMGEKEEKAHLLLLHRIHAAIFTYRRPILVAGIVLTLLLVPSAGALTAPSEGSSFDIFVGFTPPADALFINANTFNPNLPGDVYLSQTDAASSAARGEPSAPAHWRNLLLGGKMREPNVALTLWPSTAGWGVLVLVADAVLLLLAARVCWRGRTIGALRLPSYFQRMSKPARRQWVWLAGLLAAALLGIAAFVIVMGTMNPMAAAALWGCEYATWVMDLLAWVLLTHAILLGLVAIVYLSDRIALWYRGFLLNNQRARVRRLLIGVLVLVLSVGCVLGAIYLLIGAPSLSGPSGGGGGGSGGGGGGGDSGGDSGGGGLGRGVPWNVRSWQGPCLMAMWAVWATMLIVSGIWIKAGKVEHLLSMGGIGGTFGYRRQAQRSRYWAAQLIGLGVVLLLLAISTFVLMGLPFFPSDAVVGTVLAGCFVLNALFHCLMAYILLLERPASQGDSRWQTGWLGPSDWSERHRSLATCAQLMMAAGWGLPAPLVCHVSLDASTRVSGVAFGLGTLWVIDSGLCWLIGHVTSTGDPIGMIRPLFLSRSYGTASWWNQMLFSVSAYTLATATFLGGWAAIIISGSSALSLIVFDHSGANIVLGFTLIAHVPLGCLCTYVLARNRALGILRPPWAAPSPRAVSGALLWRKVYSALFAVLATLACILGAHALLSTALQDITTPSSPPPPPPSSSPLMSPPPPSPDRRSTRRQERAEGEASILTLLLAILLSIDALALWVHAVCTKAGLHRGDVVQAPAGRGVAITKARTGDLKLFRLLLLPVGLACSAAFFFYARWAPALSANLFYSRALPIAYEAIFAMHAMACAAMAASLSKDKGCPECLFGVRAGLGRPRRDEKQRLLLAYGLMAVFGIAACLPPFIRRASIQAEDDLEGLAAVLMTLCLVLLAFLDDGYMRQVSPERAGYPAADTTSRPPMNISQTRPAQGMFIGSTVEGCTAWVRRAFGLLVSGLGAGAAICYAQLFLLSSVVVSSVPAQLAGATLLVHALPLACIADAWALGVPFAGFEPSDAPRGVWLKRVVRLLLLLAVGSVVVGSALVYIGMMSSEDASAASGDEGLRQALVGLDEASLTTAEPCFMVWGVRSRLLDKASPAPNRVMLPESDNGAAADLIADFDPTSTAAQLAFDAMCTAILQPSSPLNSRAKESSSVWPWCTAHSVRRSVQQAGGAWPMAPQAFTTKLVSMLQSGPEARLGSTVGLRGQVTNNASAVLPEQLAWILVRLNSKYSTANGEMLGSPRRLEAYMREWKDYFEDLPRLTGSTVAGVARTDILSNGFVTCSSWEVFPTISAFLRGVFLSLILTPCMCLCAVFMIVRDVNICYASLLSVVCMIVVTMGVLHLMGTALGPIESLALAVIIGVSVDYLIHLAFAYNNSFMQSRYFKSRASVLARSDSIFSAAITTFAAVLPLLGARIAPLRQFGRIFTVVTVISFVYSYGFFNAFLMSMGALSTRSTTIAQDEADIQSAHADRADDVGWEDVPEEEKRGYTGRRRNQIAPAPPGFGDDEMRVDRAMRMAGEARRAELNVLAQAQRMRSELAVEMSALAQGSEMSALAQGSPMRPQRAAAPASAQGSPTRPQRAAAPASAQGSPMRPQRAAAPASAPASEAGAPPSSPRRAPINLDTTMHSSPQDDERNLDTTMHSSPKDERNLDTTNHGSPKDDERNLDTTMHSSPRDDEREPIAPAAEAARTERKPLAPASEAIKAEPIAPAAVTARTARTPLAPLAPLTGAASAPASEAEEAEPVPATVAARTEQKPLAPLAPLAAKSGGKE